MLGRCLASCLAALLLIPGCALKKREGPDPIDPRALIDKPLEPEEAKELLDKSGKNFLYGPGLGEAAVNVGGVVVFPPYAVYLLGNALLSLGGYEPLSPTQALPEDKRELFNDAYQGFVSGPGKVAAAISGREYKTGEEIDREMEEWFERRNQKFEYPD